MNKYIKLSFCGALAVFMGFSLSCTEEEPISLPPSFTLKGVTDIMRTTATFSGSISGDVSAIKSYGFEYSTSEGFPGDQTWALELSGTPSNNITATANSLEANERYYYRLFATTGVSKVYSNSEYFQTLSSSAPLLSALEVDSIGENIARFRCTVEDIGDEYLLEYGVSYKKVTDQAYIPVPSDSIVAGTTNTYFVEITGLDADTKYMFRPYAKNSADATGETGAREGYGSVIEKATEDQKSAVVTTSEIAPGNIGINSVTVSGMVKSAKGSNGVIDGCGFCWSTKNATPVITDDALEMAPSKIGEYFTTTISDLEPKTLYYVRAFARNTVNGEERIGYGETYEFTTGSLIAPKLEMELQDNGDGSYSSTYEITATSIRYKATITNYDEEALVEKGLIWSTSDGSITLAKAKENKTVLPLDIKTGGRSIDGTIDNLEINTRYYLRAYAVYQAAGMEEIGYTDVMSFHTNDFEAPRLDQAEVKDVTRYSATLIGGMSSSGNGELLEKGFCLSKMRDSYEPTLNMEGVKVVKSDDDSFTEKIDGLEQGTEYAVRTYAIAKLAERVDTTYAWYTHFVTEAINMPSFSGSAGWHGNDEGIVFSSSLDSKGDGKITENGYIWRIYDENNNSELTIENCENRQTFEIENYSDFTVTIKGLKPNSEVDVRLYIKSEIDGKEYITYSGTYRFTTGEPKTPELNSIQWKAASLNSVTVSCSVNKQGIGEIIERGFVWLLDPFDGYWKYPTIEECTAYKAVSNGTDEEFSLEVTGLEISTQYYFRAYTKMKYEDKEYISYSNSEPWSTQNYSMPEYKSINLSEDDITYSSAVFTGGFHNEGNCTILKTGFCLSESSKTSQPTINNNNFLVDADASYKATLTGLKHDTEYAVRFYATCKLEDKEETTYSGTTHFRTKRPTETTFNNVNIDETFMTSVTISSGIAEYGDGELIERGIIWKKGYWENPTFENEYYDGYQKLTTDDKEFTVDVTGLQVSTDYSFRIYVKTKVEDVEYISYSGHTSCTTNQMTMPSLNNIEQVTSSLNSITVKCGIVNSGAGEIIERGFVWLKYPEDGNWQEPRLEDNCLAYKAVTDGTNESFSLEITGLSPATNYCLRSYAKMKYDDKEYVSYSNTEVWSTQNYSLPEFTSVIIPDDEITYSSVTLNTSFYNVGNCTILKSGFCISKSSKTSQPTITNHDFMVDADDSYSAVLTGLEHNTEYAVRAYAICKVGDKEDTAYSSTTYFWTRRPTETTFNNVNISNILMASVTISSGIAEYGDGEIIERGIIWKKGYWEHPTFENNYYDGYQKLTTDKKEFTVDVTGLMVATDYSFKIYVKTKVEGVEYVYYSDWACTRTGALNFNLNITDVTLNSCKLTGIADYDLPEGITEYGFSITTEDISSYDMTDLRKGSDLNDNKEFSLEITGLRMNTHYYVGIYVKIGDTVYHADGRWDFSTKNMPTSDSNPSPDKKD